MNTELLRLLGLNGGSGILATVTGPSGAGKTTLIENFLKTYEKFFTRVVTCTSRAPRLRNGEDVMEVDGEDYHFLTEGEFLKQISEGLFIEHAQVYDYHYGTWIDEIVHRLKTAHVLLNVDVVGAENIRRFAAKEFSFVKPVDIFITPASFEVLETRLRRRNSDSPEKIDARLATARKECGEAHKFSYVIESGPIERDVEMMEAILLAELMKRQGKRIEESLKLPVPTIN